MADVQFSARRPYSHAGYRAGGRRTSMKIVPSDDAWQTQSHPIIRAHPESGRDALWINPVYTIAIDDMDPSESADLLAHLFQHMLQAEFIYKHCWEENMLVMWDNRSVMHCAQGGYAGHRRVMHRTTVAGTVPIRPEEFLMKTFVLHPQLAKDTALIGKIGDCLLLLMKDARYPWLILVPEQEVLRELHDLSDDQFTAVTQIIKQTSRRLQSLSGAPKMNVAALGNMVPQLHIHIIARRENDASWPAPVWGVDAPEAYTEEELKVLIATLREELLN